MVAWHQTSLLSSTTLKIKTLFFDFARGFVFKHEIKIVMLKIYYCLNFVSKPKLPGCIEVTFKDIKINTY